MALDYPDIIGEYINAPQRYEVNGLQYVGMFEPEQLSMGGVSNLILFLQNAADAEMEVTLKLSPPQSGAFRSHEMLHIEDQTITQKLDKAEVGFLSIPITTNEKSKTGQVSITVEVGVKVAKGVGVRHSRKKPVLPNKLFDDLVGLNLVRVVGVNYNTKNGKKNKFDLNIVAGAGENQTKNLAYQYQTLWTFDDGIGLNKARMQINDQRAKIFDDLKLEAIFTALYAESQERFAECGLLLRIGEAIAMGKILTYTVQYFLQNADLQDALLCPMWEMAIEHNIPTTETLDVLRYVGYDHILRLAMSLSFGLIAQVSKGKQTWPSEERRGLIGFISESLAQGDTLEDDFLYLPLMFGAININTQVTLPGEDIEQSLQLLAQARQARPNLFTDEAMADVNKLYTALLKKFTR